MLLVGEKLNGNRSSVLSRFPEVDPAVVARWVAINSGAPEASDGSGDEPNADDAED
jgi:hypothetical protein